MKNSQNSEKHPRNFKNRYEDYKKINGETSEVRSEKGNQDSHWQSLTVIERIRNAQNHRKKAMD